MEKHVPGPGVGSGDCALKNQGVVAVPVCLCGWQQGGWAAGWGPERDGQAATAGLID